MINFASLFGSFSRGGNSAISDLIDRPDTQLDQLLDIESFPNEYKSGNGKILQFMKYHKYKELLKYVTAEGPADNEKKGYKFPMVAAQVLSVENSVAIDYFLPDNKIEIDVEYDSTEEVEFEIEDDEEDQTQAQTIKTEEKEPETTNENTKPQAASEQPSQDASEKKTTQMKQEAETKEEEVPKPKKKKIVKQKRPVKRTKKQPQEPLMSQLFKYYEGPINYTLAGYNCKVLTTLFAKKPAQFFKFLFNNSTLNYLQLLCNHIESKSVGDLVVKMLVWETTQFLQQRKTLFDHLIKLMSELKESHALSNLSAAIYEVIEKTSTYIKSKANIASNQQIIRVFLNVFYRTSEVHKIVNNAMSEEENRSAYNCAILHAYLHFTEVQTFNSFKLEEVLQAFITKASQKLRDIPNRKVLGMGRVKIVEIFSFLIRKQPKTVEDENKTNEMSPQLLEELYIHSMIANVPDFFSILIKLLQSFDKNNILHNEIYKIFESVLKEPEQNRSALQQLLLNDENVLLKFILFEAENDKKAKSSEKYTRRRGFIAHVINLCKLIEELSGNTLINQRIRKAVEFQEVMRTLVANDTFETSKSLAGYQMKKNPARDIMFQKEDILSVYAQFLSNCPKAVFEPEEPAEDPQEPVLQQLQESQNKKADAEKQLMEEQNDEERFNEVIAKSHIDPNGQSDPKFWVTHINFDLDQLIQDVQ